MDEGGLWGVLLGPLIGSQDTGLDRERGGLQHYYNKGPDYLCGPSEAGVVHQSSLELKQRPGV